MAAIASTPAASTRSQDRSRGVHAPVARTAPVPTAVTVIENSSRPTR